MKKIAIMVAAGVFAVPAVAAPGDTDTAQGTATAEVVAPISITHDAGAALHFGTMTAGNGGTVVVDTAGAGTATGEVTLVSGSTTSADSFTVEGDADRSFSIVVADGTVSNGTDTMNFTTSVDLSTGTLDSSGTASFTVGGTLTVGAAQAAGSYAGTYDATVTYN